MIGCALKQYIRHLQLLRIRVYITSHLYTKVSRGIPATFEFKSVLVVSRHLSLLRGLEHGVSPLVSSLCPQHFIKEDKGGVFHIVYLVSSGVQVVAAPDPMTGTFFDTLHFAESYYAAERFCIVLL